VPTCAGPESEPLKLEPRWATAEPEHASRAIALAVIRSLGDDATRDIWNHALLGDLAGYHAIRVNDQYRVIFRFDGTDAHDVRCTDYR